MSSVLSISGGLQFIFELTCRTTLLLAVAMPPIWIARRHDAAATHAVLLSWTLAGILMFPLGVIVQGGTGLLPLLFDFGERATGAGSSTLEASATESGIQSTRITPSRVDADQGQPIGLAWPMMIWASYLAGAGSLLVYYGFGLFRLRRELARSNELLEPRIQAVMQDLCGKLNLLKDPRVLVSDRASAPFVAGLLRQYIVLPEHWSSWSRLELESVLAHELAHVRRGDLWSQASCVLHTILLWFHPGVWWALRRQVRLADLASDALAVSATKKPKAYASTLLRVVSRTSPGGVSTRCLVAPMVQRSDIGMRIESLQSWSRGGGLLLRPARLLLVLSAVALAAGSSALGAADPSMLQIASCVHAEHSDFSIVADFWADVPSNRGIHFSGIPYSKRDVIIIEPSSDLWNVNPTHVTGEGQREFYGAEGFSGRPIAPKHYVDGRYPEGALLVKFADGAYRMTGDGLCEELGVEGNEMSFVANDDVNSHAGPGFDDNVGRIWVHVSILRPSQDPIGD